MIRDPLETRELYLVETQNKDDELAFTFARGGLNSWYEQSRHSSSRIVQSKVIEYALETSGQEDPGTLLIRDLLVTGSVRREQVPALSELVNSLDPPIDITWQKLHELSDSGAIPEIICEVFTEAVSSDEWAKLINFISRDGLAANLSKDQQLIVTIADDIADCYGKNSQEYVESLNIDNPVSAFEHELVWDKNIPFVQTSIQHACIGQLAIDGGFEPRVSVLAVS